MAKLMCRSKGGRNMYAAMALNHGCLDLRVYLALCVCAML